MCYGYKFETLCTGNDEENDSSEKCEVDPNVCYNAVFESKINDKRQDLFHSLIYVTLPFRLLYGAEIDSFERDEEGKKTFVELKVTALLESERQKENFEKSKMLRFYCQSYLANIKHVFIGFRDNDGILSEILDFLFILFFL